MMIAKGIISVIIALIFASIVSIAFDGNVIIFFIKDRKGAKAPYNYLFGSNPITFLMM